MGCKKHLQKFVRRVPRDPLPPPPPEGAAAGAGAEPLSAAGAAAAGAEASGALAAGASCMTNVRSISRLSFNYPINTNKLLPYNQ